jgi:NADPH:quinone reductase-like Zn-dependent oxidoreductase
MLNSAIIFVHHSPYVLVLQKKGDKVVVAGATGGVGQLCVQKLLDKGFDVRVLTRSKDKAVGLWGEDKVEVCEVDLRDKQAVENKAVFKGCVGAVVAVGTTAFPTSRYCCYLIIRLHRRCFFVSVVSTLTASC